MGIFLLTVNEQNHQLLILDLCYQSDQALNSYTVLCVCVCVRVRVRVRVLT